MDTNRSLAQLIRLERDRRLLSQRELAYLSGVDQRRISEYETARRKIAPAHADQLLAAMGLQVRLLTEPLWADVDAEIAELAKLSLTHRLRRCRPMVLAILNWLGPGEPIVDGAAAALLQGAPVPVGRLDLCIASDRLEDIAAPMGRLPPVRWDDIRQWWDPDQNPDPRRPGPMRWRSHLGEFTVKVVDHLPPAITMMAWKVPVRLRPVVDVELDDPDLARILARLREHGWPNPGPPDEPDEPDELGEPGELGESDETREAR